MMRCLKVVLNCCDSIDTEAPFVFGLFIFVLFWFFKVFKDQYGD